MPKFTLTQLLMGMALAAIVLVFAKAEGCNVPDSSIDSLSFSSDGSRIAVSKVAARDQSDTHFFKPERFSRTISWLDAKRGKTIGIIHHENKKELSTNDHRQLKGSAICNPADDRIAAFEFDSDQFSLDVRFEKPYDKDSSFGGKLEYSKSGRYLALAYNGENLEKNISQGNDPNIGIEQALIVIDAANETVLQIPFSYEPTGGYTHRFVNPYAFSNDESKLIAFQDSNIEVWDLESQTMTSSTNRKWHSYLGAIATVPDDTLIACKGGSLDRMDFSGDRLALLSLNRFYNCDVSKDGSATAASRHNAVDIFDLATNTLQTTIPLAGAEAIAISPDGSSIAIGHKGKVLLFDMKTGNEIWSAVPPWHNGTPWPIPAACLFAWCIAAGALWNRKQTDSPI